MVAPYKHRNKGQQEEGLLIHRTKKADSGVTLELLSARQFIAINDDEVHTMMVQLCELLILICGNTCNYTTANSDTNSDICDHIL